MELPDLTGQRFGELVVEKLSATRPHANKGRAWVCRCDCGKTAIRTTSALRSAVKEGRKPCCHECRIELWMGMRVSIKRRVIDRLTERFRAHGYLYSHLDDRRERADLRSAMSRELGIAPPTGIDWHASSPAYCSGEFEGTRHGHRVVAKPSEAKFRSAVGRMRSWLRWQTAVDYAAASYMRGLPRVAIERLLYPAYFSMRAA